MYVRGIRCDNCPEIYNMDIIKDPLPSGWFALNEGEKLDSASSSQKHFCSLDCLKMWLAQRKKGE